MQNFGSSDPSSPITSYWQFLCWNCCYGFLPIALRFFKDPWSLFDFAVVAIALMPATGQFSVLRALRVLRVLRVLSIVPSMRRVVSALLGSLPGLGSIAMVLLLIYYVFAVIATKLFGALSLNGLALLAPLFIPCFR